MTDTRWIDAPAFADLAGISRKAATNAMKNAGDHGKSWRGASLKVCSVPSAGRGGMSWRVCVQSVADALGIDVPNSLPNNDNDRKFQTSEFGTEFGTMDNITTLRRDVLNSLPNSLPNDVPNPEKHVPNSAAEFGSLEGDVPNSNLEPSFGSSNVVCFMKRDDDQNSSPVSSETPKIGNILDGHVSAKELAELAGISDRAARTAFADGQFRKHSLNIIEVSGAGRNGVIRVAPISDLPPSLYEKARAIIGTREISQNTAVSLPDTGSALHETGERMTLALWRLELIQPALAHDRGSSARKSAAREIVGRHRQPDGRLKTVSERTIYNWIKRYEDGGIAALANKPSNAKAQPRVLITRKWDQAVRLPDAVKREIAEDLQRYIRSLWSNGTAGWRHVCQLSSAKLMELTSDAGWNTEDLHAVCDVNRSLAERARQYGVVAVHDKDAKAYFDKFLPRVSRNRYGLRPMDIVVGDVHHIDIYVRRSDGTMATPKAIVWHDIATNRLYWTLVLLDKGQNVRREHVAASFASMCSQWGLPKRLYLDNGSEYNWAEMLNGFYELARMAGEIAEFTVGLMDAEPGLRKAMGAVRQGVGKVIRARPYNAPAKPIEGQFSNIEQFYLSAVDGWIGGNRMKSKTKNVGKAPEPFPGDWPAFHETIANVLAYYHATPQRGALNGKSPNDALQAAIDDGWAGITQVEEKALLLAFANEKTCSVDRGRITWDGEYYADELLRYSGRKLRVRIAKHHPDQAFVFDGDRLIATAERDSSFGFLSPAGAREQARRAKIMRREISAMKRDCDRLDLIDEMNRFTATRAKPVSPTAQRIEVTGEVSAMITETKKFEHRQSQKAVAATSSKPLKNQWGVEDEAFSDLYD